MLGVEVAKAGMDMGWPGYELDRPRTGRVSGFNVLGMAWNGYGLGWVCAGLGMGRDELSISWPWDALEMCWTGHELVREGTAGHGLGCKFPELGMGWGLDGLSIVFSAYDLE
jgi:hypothetical protein